MRSRHPAAALAAWLIGACGAVAQAQEPVAVNLPSSACTVQPDAQWESSFAEFAKADKEHAPKLHGVLFVGSSSIGL